MTTTAANLPLPRRATRWALVTICGVLSVAGLGAAKGGKPDAHHVAKASLQSSQPVKAIEPAAKPADELMHDVPAAEEPSDTDAVLASAVTTSLRPREHKVWMQVTAYCGCKKCCGPKAQGLTASGLPVSYNGGLFVAADKKIFKFGTRLVIPGYAAGQPVEVIDRGGAIRGNHLDVYFPTHDQARQWGRQWIEVTVLD